VREWEIKNLELEAWEADRKWTGGVEINRFVVHSAKG